MTPNDNLTNFVLLGSDEICESDLRVEAQLSARKKDGTNAYMLYLGEEHLNLNVKVINRGEPAYDSSVYINHPSSLSYVGRKLIVSIESTLVQMNFRTNKLKLLKLLKLS